VKWAREQLSQNDWVILDTETTGLYDAEIVEIAIIDRTEETCSIPSSNPQFQYRQK
jgi:DNA polymerase III alpha subunit (gram-positive type)